ncbi:MAG TPA: hypothetical protein VF446_09200 [Trinickia sp.]
MAIIPVVLQFFDVSRNYNISLVLTTPGVAWSMGEGGENFLGISCNALLLDGQPPSNIQRIEFAGSALSICTGGANSGDFTLTAFIDVPDGVRWLDGYCILNEKARVLARLGDLLPVEWRGEINCVLPILSVDARRATFVFGGIRQGQVLRVQLARDDSIHGYARWCIAPLDDPSIGLIVRPAQEGLTLPIAMIGLDEEDIEITVGTTQRAQAATADLIVEAYIERVRQCRYCPPLASVRIRMDCDDGVLITARVGNRRPQYLAQTYKLFAL